MPDQLAESLRTVHSSEPKLKLRESLEKLRQEFGAEFAYFCQVTESDGALYYANSLVESGSHDPMPILQLDGTEYADAVWNPEMPSPTAVNHFVDVGRSYEPERLRDTELIQKVYVDHDIAPPLRILVYDQMDFVGYLGLSRRPHTAQFEDDAGERANQLVDEVRSVILEATRDWREAVNPRLSHAIAGPDGEVLHATTEAAEWLSEDRRQQLAGAVRRFDRGTLPSSRIVIEGAEVHMIRLDGEGGVRYLANFSRAVPARLDPRHRLTERQAEVADYAASGATIDEIATTLDVSPNTVKYHIKEIYDRLGIACRVELSDALGEA